MGRFCETPDHPSRRDFVFAGALTGFGLTLEGLVRGRAAAQDGGLGYAKAEVLPQKAKACILIWLAGGPSHIDLWDLKPEASEAVRGSFQPIASRVPGVQICEHLPRTAKIMDRVALVRSVTGPEAEHDRATQHLLTGHRPLPVTEYPSYGSVVARERGVGTALPNYIAVPTANRAMGSGYLSNAYEPFEVGGDPAQPNFQVRNLVSGFGLRLGSDRVKRRRDLVQRLDGFTPHVAATEGARARNSFYDQAYDLLTSKKAYEAFDLSREDPKLRDQYGVAAGPRPPDMPVQTPAGRANVPLPAGYTSMGQSCLLARRLVEAGVSFVTVSTTGGNQASWDTHAQNFTTLKDQLLPQLDAAYAALIEDLDRRGLLDSTLVVLMGEFGRTPRINGNAGRDHWSQAHSVVLAGGGVRRGAVIGRTDGNAEFPVDRPVTPADLAATAYTLLGIDPHKQDHTPDGRSTKLVADGQAVPELMA
jgi:hypothetical protein